MPQDSYKLRFLQQPVTFYFVFIIEILERLSYYGMYSIAALYAAQKLKLPEDVITNIFSTFIILMFFPIFIGGYISDKYIGCKNSILIGAIFMLIGYVTLSISTITTFYLALGCILTGNIFFKVAPPSLLAYSTFNEKKVIDSVFTLYYMAVNIGSFLGMAIFPNIAKHYGYTVAFSISIVGLLLTLCTLTTCYTKIPETKICQKNNKVIVFTVILALTFVCIINYCLQSDIYRQALYIVLGIAAISLFAHHLKNEVRIAKKRILVSLILIVEALIYFIPNWHNSLTIKFFAQNFANNNLFGFEINQSFFQALNPFWIFLLSPILAYWYIKQNEQGNDVAITTKFAIGILLCAIGYLLLPLGSYFPTSEGLVSANWIGIAYLCLALGELLVSGLGLAMIARLTRINSIGFMMGIWYIVTPIAILIGNQLSHTPDYIQHHLNTENALHFFSKEFLSLGVMMLIFSVVMLIISEKIFNLTSLPKALSQIKLKASYLVTSLSSKLSMRVSNYLLISSAIIVITILVLNNQMSKLMYDNQVNNWLHRFSLETPKFIRENNHKGIATEISTLKTSKLFSSFVIVNKQHDVLYSFGLKNNLTPKYLAYPDNKNLVNNKTIGYTFKPLLDKQSGIVGYYSYTTDYNHYFIPFLWLIVISLITIILLYFVSKFILNKSFKNEFIKFGYLVNRIETIIDQIKSGGSINKIYSPTHDATSEEEAKINKVISTLISEIETSHQQIKNITKETEIERQKAKLHEISRRVAHDLSTYLIGLNECIKNTPNLTEASREKLHGFIYDIETMSNDLLNKHHYSDNKNDDIRPFSILNQMLKAISLAEAKCRVHSIHLNIEIESSAYDTFAVFDKGQFKRHIINIINNAMDAKPKSKQINISLFKTDNSINIKISDDGKGIPARILTKLGKEEMTFGKHHGHGLGVYHASKDIEKWDGKLSFDSAQNIGTNVLIQFPLTQPPDWHISNLSLENINQIVIIDDNKEIHQIWKSKFKSISSTIISLYSPTIAIEWYSTNKPSNALFLIDYQFSDSSLNGIDLITKLQIYKCSLIVTGRSDEKVIADACNDLSINLIPKNCIPYISIIV